MRLHNHVVLVVPIVMQEKLDRMGCWQLVLVCDPPSTDIATMLTIIQQLNALPNAPLIHGFTVDQTALSQGHRERPHRRSPTQTAGPATAAPASASAASPAGLR